MPYEPVVTADSEALRAEVIGQAAAGEYVENGLGSDQGVGLHVANPYGEAVAPEVTFLELVGVPGDGEYVDWIIMSVLRDEFMRASDARHVEV